MRSIKGDGPNFRKKRTVPFCTLGKALVYGGDRRETRSGIRITDVFGIKTLLDEFA